MKRSFLIGNFLPAHLARLPHKQHAPASPHFSTDDLEQRLDARAQRIKARRTTYRLRLLGGLTGALAFLIMAFQLPVHSSRQMNFTQPEMELVSIQEIVQTKQIQQPPPPPRPPIPVAVPDDVVLEDEELFLDASLDIDEPLASLPPPPAEEEEEDPFDEDEVFITVEEMPEMIGGVESLYASLSYPEVARRAGIEGTVVVQLVVEPSGEPSNLQVVRSASKVLDDAALEAVQNQRFKPAKQRNRPVRVQMGIPVVFRLVN